MVGPLQNNGGPTQTHALLPGSPAVNAGDNCVALTTGGCLATPLMTDQRGYARRIGTVDIGAYEANPLVTNTNDSGAGSLRQAITDANNNSGAVIEFAITTTPSPWIIQLQSALPALTSSVQVIGPGANLLMVRRNTGGNYRIFKINSGLNVTISGLTISNGLDGDCTGGGGILNAGTLNLNEVAVSGNHGCVPGAGIYNSGILAVSRSAVSNNDSQEGGGIYNSFGADVTLTNCTFSGNQSGSQGRATTIAGKYILRTARFLITVRVSRMAQALLNRAIRSSRATRAAIIRVP